MTPSRILPDLQCALLCEQVRREANGNFFLIGVIDFVVVPRTPIVAPALSFFTRWTAGVGQFVQSVRLIAPDQTTVLQKSEVKFAMKDPTANATTLTIFQNVEFTTEGIYYVEVLVDEVMKVRFPLRVLIAPPPGAHPPPSAKSEPSQ
jgi:hypothetical protein